MSDSPPLPSPRSSPMLAGERVAFTGTLASMTHRHAAELVEQHGGTATPHVSRETSLLIVGEEGWPLEADGQPSQKLEQVTAWQQQGLSIRVLTESEWLDLLGLEARGPDVHRLYTPAVLSQLLGVPATTIRGWERMGLIRPVRKVFRLPYFDFQEVSGARRLAELLASGVSPRQIEAGLERLRRVCPGVKRPLAQLEILARDKRVLYRDERGLLEPATGQRLLEFDSEPATLLSPEAPPCPAVATSEASAELHWTAEEWAEEGCRLAAENQLVAATEAFRLSLVQKPGDPETNFHLADALYRQGNVHGALERYYSVVEFDSEYIEAWAQLGCLHAQLGQTDAALEAFEVALDAHPDFAEAHLHKAELLHQLGRASEATPHWKRYLEFDSRGPWADTARQRLNGS